MVIFAVPLHITPTIITSVGRGELASDRKLSMGVSTNDPASMPCSNREPLTINPVLLTLSRVFFLIMKFVWLVLVWTYYVQSALHATNSHRETTSALPIHIGILACGAHQHQIARAEVLHRRCSYAEYV